MTHRVLTPLAVLLLIATAATVAAAATDAEDQRSPAQRLTAMYNSPIADPMRGRLYGKVAELLKAARGLPGRIELPQVEEPQADQDAQLAAVDPESPADEPAPGLKPAAAPEPAAAVTPAAVAPQPEPAAPLPGEGWRIVSGEPVVGDEDLAHAHFRAGSYRRAASLYRRLSKADPTDAHLMLMLALSERNAGDAAAARDVLGQLRAADEEADTWAAWLDDIVDLGTLDEETLK